MIRAICYLTIVFSFCTHGVPVNAAEAVKPFQVNNKERLDSLKRSIMDYAMDHSVHVTTSAWLDDDGAVEEKVHLISSLSLDRIRVNEYKNEFGYLETVIIEAPRSEKSLWKSCPVTSLLKKRATIEVVLRYPSSNAMANLLEEAGRVIESSFLESSSLSKVAIPKLLPDYPSSVYARLVKEKPLPRATLVSKAIVTINNGVSLEVDRDRGLRTSVGGYFLTIHLIVVDDGKELYSREQTVPIPAAKLKNTMTTLADNKDVRRTITEAASIFAQDLAEVIKCEASSNLLISVLGKEIRVNGGMDLGVEVGQQLLILPDSGHFAASGLEAALEATVLASVERVYPRHATIKVISGQRSKIDGDGFLAVPVAKMDFF